MNTCGIYAIIVNDYSYMYIGQSKNIEKRIANHKYMLKANKHYNVKMQNIYNKYGKDSFSYEIIEACNENKLNERETYYIFEYGTNVHENPSFGLNLTSGGEGLKSYKQTADEKKRRNISREKYIRENPYFYKKVGESIKNAYCENEELRRKQSKNMKALHKNEKYHSHYLEVRHSEEYRKKQSEKHKGFHVSDETKAKISKANGKKVLCENGMIFDSARKANEYIKETYGLSVNVQRVCLGKRNKAAGMKFWYIKDVA